MYWGCQCLGFWPRFGPSNLNRFENSRRRWLSNDHVYGECEGVRYVNILNFSAKVTLHPLFATLRRSLSDRGSTQYFISRPLRVLILSFSIYNHRIMPDCWQSRKIGFWLWTFAAPYLSEIFWSVFYSWESGYGISNSPAWALRPLMSDFARFVSFGLSLVSYFGDLVISILGLSDCP